MTGRRRAAALLTCAVLALLTAWYAGAQLVPPTPTPAAGSVRLGPDAGEPVDGYLARLPAQLPPAGVPALALVQFATERTVAEAAASTAAIPLAAPLVTAVFRVPLPRVQTALRFEPLEPAAPQPALDNARQRARQGAAADAGRLSGRAQQVAAAEAAALAGAGCRCLLALVVQADRDGLTALAARPEVRAVQAAPAGVSARELALSPLLPEQTRRADPPPDDGPVPPP